MNKENTRVPEPPDWLGEMGEIWRRNIEVFESMIAPAGAAALDFAAVRPGERILDVGCGGGLTTLELARRVGPDGEVLGVDIAPPLIEIARRRQKASGLGNVEFLAADAGTAALGDTRFDCLFSRFGVMFFDDPVAAFSNLRRMLAPEGRMALAVWGPPAANPWIRDLMQVASRYIDIPTADLTLPGMFAFSDEARVAALLGAAGFADVKFTEWQGPQFVGGAGATPEAAASFALEATPIAELTDAAEPDLATEIRAAIAAYLAPYATAEGIPRPGTVRLVAARP